MVKCIIIEDEVLAQDVIKSHLQKIAGFELTGICNNALEAKQVLTVKEVDLIFLDIQLPGMTGLNFLRTLQNPPLVILTTAYTEYAIESYEFNVIDYLLKPISFERFSKAVNKVIESKLLLQKLKADHIYIKSSGKYFKINFSDIIFIEGMKDYLKIFTADATIVTLQTMNEMEKQLPADQFIRVHKSYIVSLARIKSIYGNNIETGKSTIPIGINYKEKVMQLTGKKFG
ncbi:MAG: response regulator transcription factor [Parafilimonas sp.]|nr:response regulator transcription factor [Parafilimonas sp.]